MSTALEKVLNITSNNLFDNASVTTCTTAVEDLSNNLVSRINAVIDGDTMSVPLNPDNRHYQAIQEWVTEGNTIEEAAYCIAEPPPIILVGYIEPIWSYT